MPLRSLRLKVKRRMLHSLSTSRFRRHVSEVRAIGEWQAQDVKLLQSLSSLTRLELAINAASVESLLLAPFTRPGSPVRDLLFPFRLPLALTHLSLRIPSNSSQLAQQTLLKVLAWCVHLVRLELTLANSPAVDLSFLQWIPNLSSFTLAGIELKSEHITAIRQLPLTELSVSSHEWEVEELSQLLQPPSRLRLRKFDLSSTSAGEEELQALLPLADKLKVLEPYYLDSACFSLLPRFRALRRLALGWEDELSEEEPEEIIAALLQHLPSCTSLIELRLCGLDFSGSQLQQLLQSLPQLETLELSSCSLADPTQLRYGLALKTLTLVECGLPPDTLSTLQQLPALTSLTLNEAFDPPIDESILEQLTFPSPLFPNLTFLTVSQLITKS